MVEADRLLTPSGGSFLPVAGGAVSLALGGCAAPSLRRYQALLEKGSYCTGQLSLQKV